ncbi:hypothetical protein CANINC_002856 [Pichia inconspicua]|uniref:Zn(2)-C6 fungal-type domain-containing protein n=1 Tax=Pichia inconspicua TaxID=52247 RepID=A0A4T0X063_9ASCO|nr:hypothetical protein CANINC_002856 [[Candida] inconspicua]
MTFNFTADLACYSLACNSNVPATPLDLNHYYTYRRGTPVATSTPPQTSAFLASTSVANQTLSDTKATTPAATPAATTPATAAVPTNNTGGTSIPRKLSKLDLLIQTATELHAPSSTSVATPTSPQQPTSFDILCSHAHKELQSATATSSSTTTTASTPTPDSRPKKNNKRRRDDSSNASTTAANLAIKLASPSATTKRQRSGPSCDCCRARKIKCDSEIFILSTLDPDLHTTEDASTNEANSYIAHCQFIVSSNKTGYQYYRIIKDQEHSLNNKLTSFNYLQFKPCKACTVKNLKCCFSKGFTRNDIIKFNKSEREVNPPQIPTPTNTPTPIDSVSQIKQSQVTSQPTQQPALPTPSPTPAESSPLNSDDDDRKTKKTSCKTCRFKKIKCVKVGKGCMYCSKKGVPCIYT